MRSPCHHDRVTENPSPLRERVAEELRAILARRKMTATTLAELTGLTQPYLSRRMTGDVAFNIDDLDKIASVLEVPVTALLGDAAPIAPFIPQQQRRQLVA